MRLIKSYSSPIRAIRYRVAIDGLKAVSQDIQATFRKVLDIDEEFEAHATSTIHDVILGSQKMSLQEALDMEPSKVDALDHLGFTPLRWSIHLDDIETLEKLLSFGANINLVNSTESTPLHIACAQRRNTTMLSMIIHAGAKVDAKDSTSYTPLHLAAEANHQEAICLLCHRGANPNARSNTGATPLHLLATFASSSIRNSTITLLGQGAALESKDKYGATPCMVSTMYNPMSSIEFIDMGAKPETCDKIGQNILHKVALYWNRHEVERLREIELSRVDPDIIDNRGDSPCALLWYRMTVKEADRYARWRQPTLGLVWTFTCLILEIRERNWANGLFMYSKTRFLADRSHQKMWKWAKRYGDIFQENQNLINQPWTATDGWWFEEQLEETDIETDSGWEDYDSSDDDEEGAAILLVGDTEGLGELQADPDDSSDADSDAFFDAE